MQKIKFASMMLGSLCLFTGLLNLAIGSTIVGIAVITVGVVTLTNANLIK